MPQRPLEQVTHPCHTFIHPNNTESPTATSFPHHSFHNINPRHLLNPPIQRPKRQHRPQPRRRSRILKPLPPQRPLDRLSRRLINRALRQRSPCRRPMILGKVGHDGPGLEIDDRDAEGSELQALRVGKHGHGRLGGVVRGLKRQRHDRRDGRLVHDHPLGFQQERQEGLRDREVGPHVEVEELLGLGDGEVGDGHGVPGAGVVD